MPTPNVSVVDLVIQTEKKTFAEEVRSPQYLRCGFCIADGMHAAAGEQQLDPDLTGEPDPDGCY